MLIKSNMKHTNKPVVILFIIMLTFGILYCVFIPYGAGFDEEAHAIRIFDVSGLNMVPNRGAESGNFTLSEFFSLSYQRRDFQNPAFDQFSAVRFMVKADWQSMSDGTTRSHYFPANYFLPAIVAGVGWRVFDFPILPVVILMKIVGLFFYLIACYWTFHMLPIGKWVFLVTAFTPMALFLTGTLNADIFTLGCSYLFIGAVLEYYSKRDLHPASYLPWKLILFVFLIGCTKPGTIVILLLLLILIKKNVRSKKTAVLLGITVLLSAAVSIRWMMFSVDDANFLLWTQQRTLSSQVRVIFANLVDFIRFYFSGIFHSLRNYYEGLVGVYGYWVGKVPFLVYVFFPVALLFAFLSEKNNKLLNSMRMFIVILTGLICMAEIAAFHFVAFYFPGTENVDKVGRYFLPFLPLLVIPFAGRFEIKDNFRKVSLSLCIFFMIATVALFGYGIYRTYYTDCVYAVTKESPCVLPVYKNIDVEKPYVAHVTNAIEVEQSFIAKCDGLQTVKIRVETVKADPGDKFTMAILGEDKQLLDSMEFQIAGLQKGDMLEMQTDIKAIPDESIFWIALKINASTSNSVDVGFLGREPGKKYADGELLFNNDLQDGDLFFQYTCKQ